MPSNSKPKPATKRGTEPGEFVRMKQRYTAVRLVALREWEAGDWIESTHPKWHKRAQRITGVGKAKVQVTDWREDGTRYTRWLEWLPADIRLVRKGVRDVA